jgi:hypothetical protein
MVYLVFGAIALGILYALIFSRGFRIAVGLLVSVDAVLMPGRLAERGVAIPGPGDYVRVWIS